MIVRVEDDRGESNSISAVIQIEISKNLDKFIESKDIYENLYRDLIELYTLFEDDFREYRDSYCNIEYFKSLGPKDIIINIDLATIDIFMVRRLYMRNIGEHTTFYINSDVDTSNIAPLGSIHSYHT